MRMERALQTLQARVCFALSIYGVHPRSSESHFDSPSNAPIK